MGDPAAERIARLHALAGPPFGVARATCEAVVRYLDAMLAENARVNLTAIRDPEDALVLHALDSLACAPDLPSTPTRALDLGTGNGFPGVALARLLPTGSETLLLDRTRRKVLAIQRAIEAAWPDGPAVRTVHADAQQLPGLGEERFALVAARAVDEPAAVGRLAGPLLEPAGSLMLWLAAETPAPERLGSTFDLTGVRSYELPGAAGRETRQRRLARYVRR